MEHDRHGARQPERFDPARAAGLNDSARFNYLSPGDVLSMLDTPQGATLVDFGAGTGLYAIEIASARPDLSVIALDEQEKMLEFLRVNLAQRPTPHLRPLLSKDVEAKKLRGQVDRILALNVLHELGDDAMIELKALLNKTGRVLFIDWNSEVERPIGPPKDHVYSVSEGVARVEHFGFSVVERRLFLYHYALSCVLKSV